MDHRLEIGYIARNHWDGLVRNRTGHLVDNLWRKLGDKMLSVTIWGRNWQLHHDLRSPKNQPKTLKSITGGER